VKFVRLKQKMDVDEVVGIVESVNGVLRMGGCGLML
jgi:hypothetical protein